MNKRLRQGDLLTATLVDPPAVESVTKHSTCAVVPFSEARATPEPDFDWTDNNAVVLHEQPATAVYFNTQDGLVIRQERTWDREEDTFIVISKENVQQFVDKLTDICGVPSIGRRA
jgi:hypothetical protein